MNSAANPPACNTGGTSPSADAATHNVTILDTVAFVIPTKGLEGSEAELGPICRQLLTFFPNGCEWAPLTKGPRDYPYQSQLVCGGIVVGWIAFGCSHNKQWFYITGQGLRLRRERGLTDASLVGILDIAEGTIIKRIDIALDIFEHCRFSVDKALEAYNREIDERDRWRKGEHLVPFPGFRLSNAPKSPCKSEYKSTTNNPAFPEARTLYVGWHTDTKKFVRIYDKGLEILGKLTPEELAVYRDNGDLAVIRSEAVPKDRNIEEYTRVELQLMHDKKKKPIDREIFEIHDQYFAGAYPILAYLLGRNDGIRPEYIPKKGEVELAKLLLYKKEAYGNVDYYLRSVLGWDDTRIVNAAIGDKIPRRLKVHREAPSSGEQEQ